MSEESSRKVVSTSDTASPITVVKVGGGLLRNRADLVRAAAAIADRRQHRPRLLVVASALKGVTDLLELAALRALDRRLRAVDIERTVEDLRHFHEGIARDITDGGVALSQIQSPLSEIERLLGSIRATGELPESTYAHLLSSGERLSVPLLAAAIRAAGQDAAPLTAEELRLRARGSPRVGVCDIAGSSEGFRRLRSDLRHRVMVLTGFYGIDRNGRVVLFGRGGSDDTACAVAAGLDAARLELWKDVPGFMSADPHKVQDAHTITELSFDEVAQLGAYGSAVLHHGCLEPLRGRRTKILICSLNSAGAAGTHLLERLRRPRAKVVALTTSSGRAEFRLACGHVNGAGGLAGRVLSSLGDAEIRVETMSTQKTALRFVVADASAEQTSAALRGMVDHRRVRIKRFPSLIGAVGDGVAADTRIGTRMLGCLVDLGVRSNMVAKPAGRSGLSCTVHQEDLAPALTGLHEHFFADARPAVAGT